MIRRERRVFDRSGAEVFITYTCRKCGKTRPLSAFGLRKMGNGVIRNIPWCSECRSAGSRTPNRPPSPGQLVVGVDSGRKDEVPAEVYAAGGAAAVEAGGSGKSSSGGPPAAEAPTTGGAP